MLLLSKKHFFHSFHGCPDYHVGAIFFCGMPGKGQAPGLSRFLSAKAVIK